MKTLRLWACLIAALVMGSCVPRYLTPGPPITSPLAVPGELLARDGTRLALTEWPAPSPKAIVIALHGFNDYGAAFARPAKLLNEQGISVFALDQRGFGETPVSGRWPGTQAFLDDLTDAVALLKARNRGLPLYIMGESMGGAVALAWSGQAKPDTIDGLILVAPAVWGWRNLNLLYRSALWIGAQIAPSRTLTGRGLDIWPSDNMDMLREFSRDPRVIKATRIDALYGLVSIMDAGYKAAGTIRVPTLVLYGQQDQVIPKRPVFRLVQALGSNTRFAYYPKGYHMLLRDVNGAIPTRDIAAWILNRQAALPSQDEARAIP